MPHTYLGGPRDEAEKYLQAGMVYVTCGNRGIDSRDEEGKLCGKSPMNLVDLKTGIRFIRHNKNSIPGDMNKMISVGWSAGGAMSTLLAVTGNHKDFDDYLMHKLNESASKFLSGLSEGSIDKPYSVKDYLEGNYTRIVPCAPPQKKDRPDNQMSHFAGQGVELGLDSPMNNIPMEPPTLGDLVSRPPKGIPSMPPFKPPVQEVKGVDKKEWLLWNGKEAIIKDLDTYILKYRRRMKNILCILTIIY